MIRHDVEQGSPEWIMLRLGIPTCSSFDKIITPAKLTPSSQAPMFRNQLLAEWLLGYPLDFGGESQYMERGKRMEPEARAWYEFQHDVQVDLVGFLTRDDGRVGGSPDALVGADGGLEIKCPAIHTHIGYMMDPRTLVAAYRNQVQGYLYLTGRKWWDLMSYSPELPPVVERIEPDERHQAALAAALDAFVDDLWAGRAKLERHRRPVLAGMAA